MDDLTHLANGRSGKTHCGIPGHGIYTRKGPQLVAMNRIGEVDCDKCLVTAHGWYETQAGAYHNLANEVFERLVDVRDGTRRDKEWR